MDFAISSNYLFCFTRLKNLFLSKDLEFDQFYNDEEQVRKLIVTILWTSEKYMGISMPAEYVLMPVYFKENDNYKAIIFALPDASRECDCNYVAIRSDSEGKLLLITSELYVFTKSFGLCVSTLKAHYALNYQPKSLDEFVDLTLSISGNYE